VQSGDVRVLDVRTPAETTHGIIPGAALIPVDQLEDRWKEIPKDKKQLLVYCAGGGRSAAACEFLSQQGYDSVFNLEGGFSSWTGPTARPK
jgi:rhodanese-related sulfurtransferase